MECPRTCPQPRSSTLRTLGWVYTAGFLGIFAICHTPGFTDADGKLFGLFRIDPIRRLISSTDTAEDALARRTAREYGTFMHRTPWHEFPFGSRLAALWREVPWTGPHMVRKIERRMALTAEYAIKAVYGFIIRKASGAAYEGEDLRIYARVADTPLPVLSDQRVKVVQTIGPRQYIVTLPRYEDFTATALALTAKGARFTDIAGNDVLLMTALARRGIPTSFPAAELVSARPILTDPTMQRLALRVRVASLGEAVEQLARAGASVEHLYDY